MKFFLERLNKSNTFDIDVYVNILNWSKRNHSNMSSKRFHFSNSVYVNIILRH